MVIVPSTPIIFRLSLFIERKIMKQSTNVAFSFLDNLIELVFRVCADLRMRKGINVAGKKDAGINHDLGKSLNVSLAIFSNSLHLWYILNPSVRAKKLFFNGSKVMLCLRCRSVGLICHSVQIVACLWDVVFSLKLLYSVGPASAEVDLRSFVFNQFLFWEVR